MQKYLSVTNHMWSAYHFLGNMDAWNALPPDVQAASSNATSPSSADAAARHALRNDSLADKLARRGMAINKADPGGFRSQAGRLGLLRAMAREVRDTGLEPAGKDVREAGLRRRIIRRAPLASAPAELAGPGRPRRLPSSGPRLQFPDRVQANCDNRAVKQTALDAIVASTDNTVRPGAYPGDAALHATIKRIGGAFAYWNAQPFRAPDTAKALGLSGDMLTLKRAVVTNAIDSANHSRPIWLTFATPKGERPCTSAPTTSRTSASRAKPTFKSAG